MIPAQSIADAINQLEIGREVALTTIDGQTVVITSVEGDSRYTFHLYDNSGMNPLESAGFDWGYASFDGTALNLDGLYIHIRIPLDAIEAYEGLSTGIAEMEAIQYD